MEINHFIKNLANLFDETEQDVFTPDTHFRELEEWSSLVALAAMNMCAKKFNAKILPAEMRTVNTIQELFDLVVSKQ